MTCDMCIICFIHMRCDMCIICLTHMTCTTILHIIYTLHITWYTIHTTNTEHIDGRDSISKRVSDDVGVKQSPKPYMIDV